MWDEITPAPGSALDTQVFERQAQLLRLHRRRQCIGAALIAAVVVGRNHLIGAASGARVFHDGLSHFALIVVLFVASAWLLNDLYDRFTTSNSSQAEERRDTEPDLLPTVDSFTTDSITTDSLTSDSLTVETSPTHRTDSG